jgi:general stress protein YciG
MSREKQRAIASKGGKAAHAQGTAHEFTSEEARAAGRKGGIVTAQKPGHMAKIGRKGGQTSVKPKGPREQLVEA